MKKAETIVQSQNALGEGPVWDDQRQRIFWVDILGKTVHWADENGEDHQTFLCPDYVSNIYLTSEGSHLILSLPEAFYLWNPENRVLEKWVDLPYYDPQIRTNDGFCDPHGNLWIGTMGLSEKPGLGNLYMLDRNMKWHLMLERTSISNGIRCNPDGLDYFYIDTPTHMIRKFRFDPDQNRWEFIRTIGQILPETGHPDGMSMDAEGRLWISLWDGYGVICMDTETGEILDKIRVPAPQVSANIFGGKNKDQLFITSARKQMTQKALDEYPETGNLFRIQMEVKGGETYRRAL